MSGLNRCEVHIVEDNLYARDALAMYCAKHEKISVRCVTSFGKLGFGEYAWPRRTEDAVPSVALISHNNPRVIKSTLTWFEANVKDVIAVVLLSRPTAANVKASVRPCTRGIVCAEEVGIAIGEVVAACAEGEFIATAQVVPHLFAEIESAPSNRPTVVARENPLKHASETLEFTMRMFCAWNMSNGQIARHFGISQNTISSRIRAGYLTMKVGSRDEATKALLGAISGL